MLPLFRAVVNFCSINRLFKFFFHSSELKPQLSSISANAEIFNQFGKEANKDAGWNIKFKIRINQAKGRSTILMGRKQAYPNSEKNEE